MGWSPKGIQLRCDVQRSGAARSAARRSGNGEQSAHQRTWGSVVSWWGGCPPPLQGEASRRVAMRGDAQALGLTPCGCPGAHRSCRPRRSAAINSSSVGRCGSRSKYSRRKARFLRVRGNPWSRSASRAGGYHVVMAALTPSLPSVWEPPCRPAPSSAAGAGRLEWMRQ